MFTGLVQEAGRVCSFGPGPAGGRRLVVEAPLVAPGLAVGDSVAVAGACLTVVTKEGLQLGFDVLEETVRCTSMARLGDGSRINLETSLKVGDALGGHFVTGHVDCTGTVVERMPQGADTILRIVPPEKFLHLLVHKGSIAVDGVSLTVASLGEKEFTIWLIPHTLEITTLGELQPGDTVNLEFDLLAKQVVRFMELREDRT